MFDIFKILVELVKNYGVTSAILMVVMLNLFLTYLNYKQQKKHAKTTERNKEKYLKSNSLTIKSVNESMEKSLNQLKVSIKTEISHKAETQDLRQGAHAEALGEVIVIIQDLEKQVAEVRGMIGASLMIGHKGVK